MTYTTPGGSYSRLYADMADRVHLLIAGTTGSGKSTVINGILNAMLHSLPTERRFILIDLKKVELADYRDMPHTEAYADDTDSAVAALQAAITTTEARYKDMQRRHLRQYDGSHMYIIIDELADLLTTVAKQATPIIQRLCQIGRGARVHVIAATQHIPEIPTSIRCNFDARVALKTVNRQDSRNIVYIPGAECFPDPVTEHKALGYYLRGSGDPELYQIPMLPEAERLRVIAHWANQARPRLLRLFA